MTSSLSITGKSIPAVELSVKAHNSSQNTINELVTSEPQKPFFSKETLADQKIALAFEKGIIDADRRVTDKYRNCDIPSGEFLQEFIYNISLTLQIHFRVNGGVKSFQAFLNDQYAQSLKEGNPIEYHEYIGSSLFKFGGRTFLKALFDKAQISFLLDEQAYQHFETTPNDLDIRERSKNRVTLQQVNDHTCAAKEFFGGADIKYNESKNDPNRILKMEGAYPGNKGKILIEFGFGNFPDFSLTNRTGVHIGLDARELSRNNIKIVFLHAPGMFLKAYLDHLFGIADVEDRKEAASKNYVSVISLVSEVIRERKCYHLSLYQDWIANHAAHFEEKWGLWPKKLTELTTNSISGHLKDKTEAPLLFFLQYEILLEYATSEVKSKFGKGLVDSAWMNLMLGNPLKGHWLYSARNKGISAPIMRYFIQAGAGLAWSICSKHQAGGFQFDLSCLFDQPHIQMSSSQGIVWMLSWNLSIPENLEEILAPFLAYEDQLFDVISNCCSYTNKGTVEEPVLRKYVSLLPPVLPQNVEKAKKLLESDNPLIQFLAFSYLIQMQTLGVRELDNDIYVKAIPKLLECNKRKIQSLTLEFLGQHILACTAAHLHPILKKSLEECFSLSGWLKVLAATRELKFVTIAKEQWKEMTSIGSAIDLQFILNLFLLFPGEGLECLNSYLKDGGVLQANLLEELKAKFKTLPMNVPLLLSHWITISDICQRLSIDLDISSFEHKDRISKYYAAFYTNFRKAKTQEEKSALKQEFEVLGTNLLAICESAPWKSECHLTAQILSSRIFAEMEEHHEGILERFLSILGKSIPHSSPSKLTISMMAALLTKYLNNTTAIDTESSSVKTRERSSVQGLSQKDLILYIFQHLKKHGLIERKYRLLLACLNNPGLSHISGDDLTNLINIFFESPLSFNFPILPLLEKYFACHPNSIEKFNTPVVLQILSYLLQLENANALPIIKKLISKSNDELQLKEEWHKLANATALAARHFSDSELFYIHAERAGNSIKNSLLIEAVEIEITNQSPSAYQALIDLCKKYEDLSEEHKNNLHRCIEIFFKKPFFAKNASEWCLACSLKPPVNAEVWFECVDNLVKNFEYPEVLNALTTTLLNELRNKSTSLAFKTIARAGKVLITHVNSFSWHFLELIFPFLDSADVPKWTTCVQNHLKELIAHEKPIDALLVLNCKHFECNDSSIVDAAFRYIFADVELIPNNLSEAIRKHRNVLTEKLWGFIWSKVALTGKSKIAKEIFLQWKSANIPFTADVFLALVLCSAEELAPYLKDLELSKQLLVNHPQKSNLFNHIFRYLVKRKSSEELLLHWIGILNSCEIPHPTHHFKVIPYALNRGYLGLLNACIKITSEQVKLYQNNPRSVELKTYVEPYFEEEWPLKANTYIGTQLLLFLRLLLDGKQFAAPLKNNIIAWLLNVDFGEENEINKLRFGRISAILDATLYYKTLPEKTLNLLFDNILQVYSEPLICSQLISVLAHLESFKLNPYLENKRKDILRKVFTQKIEASNQKDKGQLDQRLENLKLFVRHANLFLDKSSLIPVLVTLLGLLKHENNTVEFEKYLNIIIKIFDNLKDKKNAAKFQILLCEFLVRPVFNDEKIVDCHIRSIEKVILKIIREINHKAYEHFPHDVVNLLEKIVFHYYTFGQTTFSKYKPSALSILSSAKANGYIIENSNLEMLLFFLRENLSSRKTTEDLLPVFWMTFKHLKEHHKKLIEHSLNSCLYHIFNKPSVVCKIALLKITLKALQNELSQLDPLPYQFYYNLSCVLDKTLHRLNLSVQDKIDFLDIYYFIFANCRKSLAKPSYIISEGHGTMAQTCISYILSLKDASMFSCTVAEGGNTHTILTMSDRYNKFLNILMESILIIGKKLPFPAQASSESLPVLKEMLLSIIEMINVHPFLGVCENEMIDLVVLYTKKVYYDFTMDQATAILKHYFAKAPKENVINTFWKIIERLPTDLFDSAYFALLTYTGKPLSTMRMIYDRACKYIEESPQIQCKSAFDYAFLFINLSQIYINRPIALEIDEELIDLNQTLGTIFSYLFNSKRAITNSIPVFREENKIEYSYNYSLVKHFQGFLNDRAIDIQHPAILSLFFSLTLDMLRNSPNSQEFLLGCELVHFAKEAGFFAEASIDKQKWIYRVLNELQLFPNSDNTGYEWTLTLLLERIPPNTHNCITLLSLESMLDKGFFASFDQYVLSTLPKEHLIALYRHATLMACQFRKLDFALQYVKNFISLTDQDVSKIVSLIIALCESSKASLDIEKLTFLYSICKGSSSLFINNASFFLHQLMALKKPALPLFIEAANRYIPCCTNPVNDQTLAKLLTHCCGYNVQLPISSKTFIVILEFLTGLFSRSDPFSHQKQLLRLLGRQTDFWENCALTSTSNFLVLLKMISAGEIPLLTPCYDLLCIYKSILNESERHQCATQLLTFFKQKQIKFDVNDRRLLLLLSWVTEPCVQSNELFLAVLEGSSNTQVFKEVASHIRRYIKIAKTPKESALLAALIHMLLDKRYEANLPDLELIILCAENALNIDPFLMAATLYKLKDRALLPLAAEYIEKAIQGSFNFENTSRKVILFAVSTYICAESISKKRAVECILIAAKKKLIHSREQSSLLVTLIRHVFISEEENHVKLDFYLEHYNNIPQEHQPLLLIEAIKLTHLQNADQGYQYAVKLSEIYQNANNTLKGSPSLEEVCKPVSLCKAYWNRNRSAAISLAFLEAALLSTEILPFKFMNVCYKHLNTVYLEHNKDPYIFPYALIHVLLCRGMIDDRDRYNVHITICKKYSEYLNSQDDISALVKNIATYIICRGVVVFFLAEKNPNKKIQSVVKLSRDSLSILFKFFNQGNSWNQLIIQGGLLNSSQLTLYKNAPQEWMLLYEQYLRDFYKKLKKSNYISEDFFVNFHNIFIDIKNNLKENGYTKCIYFIRKIITLFYSATENESFQKLVLTERYNINKSILGVTLAAIEHGVFEDSKYFNPLEAYLKRCVHIAYELLDAAPLNDNLDKVVSHLGRVTGYLSFNIDRVSAWSNISDRKKRQAIILINWLQLLYERDGFYAYFTFKIVSTCVPIQRILKQAPEEYMNLSALIQMYVLRRNIVLITKFTQHATSAIVFFEKVLKDKGWA